MGARTKINLEPMPGKLIIKPDQSEKEINGIYIIRNSNQSVGQVVAVYDDFVDPDNDAEVSAFIDLDDWVIFGQHSGVSVSVGREKYIILREAEILCRILPEGDQPPAEIEAI